MSNLDDLAFVPEQFSGRVRLFPLPNLVMFPSVMQPLHIFEPRYREMLEDSLADDCLIALAVLAPGWEKQYEGRPPVGKVACLGRVATSQPQADETYNVLLLGLRRVGLVRELPPVRSFREAEVEVYEDLYPPGGAASRPGLQRRLVEGFKKVLPNLTEAQDQLDQLLASNMPLGMLTDIIGYTLDLNLRFKEKLLGECNVDQRAELLLDQLKQQQDEEPVAAARDGFPPAFSIN